MTIQKEFENYRELFCRVTFEDQKIIVQKCAEIDFPEMAEVAIPYQGEKYLYSITCYITNLPNNYPAINEMLILKENAFALYCELVEKEI